MQDVQGAVKEIEAEVDATTGGGLRSIRELTESSATLLQEARSDAEAATSSAQAAIESSPPAEPAVAEPVAATPAPSSAPESEPAAPSSPGINGAYGDPFEAAEVKRREAAAREAAARITGGGL
jgi:hypothetical protein